MAKAIWEGQVIAESDDFEVVEGNVYFPPSTINQEFLEPSGHHSVCPGLGTRELQRERHSVRRSGGFEFDAAQCRDSRPPCVRDC